MLKILLCNPVRYTIYDIENQLQPLGLLYIVSYLRKYLDEKLEFKYCNWNYEKEFLSFKPDIVFMPTVTPYYNIEMEVAKRYKELDENVSIIVGGYHISALPKTMSKSMDIGVVGEGEVTTLELMKNFNNPEKVKGLCYWNNNKILMTEPRSLIRHLDVLPFPARDVVKNFIKSYDFTDIITSRGCPFNCIFCASTRFWRNKTRFHSAEYVVEEIKEVVEKYTRRINFVDDLFTINKKRLRRIVELVEENGLDLEVNTSARADTLDEEICKLLKRLGIVNLCFGFESASPRVLCYLKGGKATPDENIRAVRLCNKYGIGVSASFIIGSPNETREEILQTLEFAKHKGLRYVLGNVLSPLPNTPLWDEAKEKGLVTNNMDWEELNFCLHNSSTHNKTIIMNENLSREEIYELWNEFDKINKKLLRKDQLTSGIRHPVRALRYIWQRVRWKFK